MTRTPSQGASAANNQPRVIVLANTSKAQVKQALQQFRPWLAQRACIVAEPDTRTLNRAGANALPDADLAVVLGGDGTMLAMARAFIDRDMPLVGINFGKIGFLAEFNLQDFQQHWPIISTQPELSTQRLMIDVRVFDDDNALDITRFNPDQADADDPQSVFDAVALNDAVISAGTPFRMIEVDLTIDPRQHGAKATTFNGDGVIVATPSGSTAYNLAAGGPIVSPVIDGVCVTVVCPYSLAARPIVCPASCDIWLRVNRANPGTTLVIDGQQSTTLRVGQRVLVRRHPRNFRLIHNPHLNYWNMLARKLRWAAPPTNH